MAWIKRHRVASTLIAFVVSFIASYVIAYGVSVSGVDNGNTVATFLNDAATLLIGLVLVVAAKPKGVASVSGRQRVNNVLIAVVMLVFVWLAGTLGATLVQVMTEDVMYESYARMAADMGWVYTFCAIIVAPVVEETLYRGGIFGQLAHTRMPLLASAAVTSALFAIAHMTLAHLIPTFLFGMLLCWAYVATGKLGVCIGLHMAYNCISQLMVGVEVPEWLQDPVLVIVSCVVVVVAQACLLARDETLHAPDVERADIQGA